MPCDLNVEQKNGSMIRVLNFDSTNHHNFFIAEPSH